MQIAIKKLELNQETLRNLTEPLAGIQCMPLTEVYTKCLSTCGTCANEVPEPNRRADVLQ